MSNALEAVRGDREQYSLTLTDGNGDPLELTDALVWFTVKRRYGDDDDAALLQKTTVEGIELGGDPGSATVTIEPADTAGCPDHMTRYVYDIQVKTLDGVVSTPVRDTFTVWPDVTRSTEVGS